MPLSRGREAAPAPAPAPRSGDPPPAQGPRSGDPPPAPGPDRLARRKPGAKLPKEIERGNVAAGLAAGSHYVATGIITSHAMAGNDLQTLGISCVFFVIGQLTLHLFVSLFRALTTYDDSEQIAGENLAAALSYAGAAIAIAIIIARATEGDFDGWASSLKGYVGVLLGLL